MKWRLLELLVAGLLGVALGWAIFSPPWGPAIPATAKTSLQETWEGRILTIRPDGCVELKTERGRRTFIYQNGWWRECVPTPKKPR